MTRTAILGGGAAGMAAARTLLAAGTDVVLFEAGPQLGGNCLGITVPGPDGSPCTIDAGVSDFNRSTFTGFARAIDDLGLPTLPIGTDASFATTEGRTVANCRGGRWQCDPAFAGAAGLEDEVARFRVRVVEGCEPRFAGWTLGRYLDHVGASAALRHVYALPRAMGCFPMPDVAPEAMPLHGLVEFWRIHGVVGEVPANRHCVVGGMHRYPVAVAKALVAAGGELHCSTRVQRVVQRSGHVDLIVVDREGRSRREVVDHVMCAMPPAAATALFAGARAQTCAPLRAFRSQQARVVVHRDDRLVGDDRAAWGGFHYLVAGKEVPRVRPTITFYPARLAKIDRAEGVFVTMNPHREPRREHVLAECRFVHPVFGERPAAAAAFAARPGQGRIWFAGAHLQSPFVHESAWCSGERAAQLLLEARLPVERLRRRAQTVA